MRKKFGFIGQDSIGIRMAIRRLLESGHEVSAYNQIAVKKHQVAGASNLPTPNEVVKFADITFCCVPDSETVRDVSFFPSFFQISIAYYFLFVVNFWTKWNLLVRRNSSGQGLCRVWLDWLKHIKSKRNGTGFGWHETFGGASFRSAVAT